MAIGKQITRGISRFGLGREEIAAIIRRAPWTFVPLAVYWVGLFLATHWPSYSSGQRIPHGDKFGHLGGYAVLAFLWCWTMWGMRASGAAVTASWFVLAAYGAVDELTQVWAINRTADFWDWVANSVGLVVGFSAYIAVSRCFRVVYLAERVVSSPSAKDEE